MKNILRNPLLQEIHSRYRKELIKHFPELDDCSHDDILGLYKYIQQKPQKFYSEAVYSKFMNWLIEQDRCDRARFQTYLVDHDHELNKAFLHLSEINSYAWHDNYEEADEYEFIRFIDQEIHPAYLRLCEAVLTPFLRIAAHFSRVDRNVGTEGLDIYNIVEEIRNSNLCEATLAYKKIIRNGIGHGGITYLQKEIRYEDRQNREKFSDTEVVHFFDDLLDDCNALALAISVFLLSKRIDGYNLLQQIFLSELTETTKTPWWKIIGCAPSEFANLNQLIVYAHLRTNDYDKIFMSSFQSGILAERFMPGYSRYLVSFRNNKRLFGFTAFNGEKLMMLREKKASLIKDYKDVVDTTFCFPFKKTRIRFFKKIQNLLIAFKIHIPLALDDLKKEFGIPVINVRNAKIHRNAWGCVLNGNVVVYAQVDDVDQACIRKFKRRIVRKALAVARKKSSFTEVARYLPLGFARISVLCKDYRRRHLDSFGLRPELVGTIQVQRICRIRCPDIIGSTVEQKGKYRIAWNQRWLESFNSYSPSDS